MLMGGSRGLSGVVMSDGERAVTNRPAGRYRARGKSPVAVPARCRIVCCARDVTGRAGLARGNGQSNSKVDIDGGFVDSGGRGRHWSRTERCLGVRVAVMQMMPTITRA